MHKLVSVIIPCFNAEKWLNECIDSCLQQTYPNVEIIVIDDGSSDHSLEIIKSYGNKIIWESCPHLGGNYARNRAFSLSRGEYIQFLDADDLILPEKISRQVSLLETTAYDVIYGDWQYQYHLPDGTVLLDLIEVSGEQTDILKSLLEDWWTAVASLLYRRTAVENSGGWDENLQAAQDRDFFLSIVMNGARVVYQPGCYAIYRRYGNVTVSTKSKPRQIRNQSVVTEKAKKRLLQENRLSTTYRHALAKCYFNLAREALCIDYSLYLQLIEAALTLAPEYKRQSQKQFYAILQTMLGFRRTEMIVGQMLRLQNFLDTQIFNSNQYQNHQCNSVLNCGNIDMRVAE